MTLRIVFLFALLLGATALMGSGAAQGADAPSSIKLMIDIPEIWHNGKLVSPRTLECLDSNAQFFLVVENISSAPIYLRRQNGLINDLSFAVTGDNGQTTLVRRIAVAPAATALDDLWLGSGQATVLAIRYVPLANGSPTNTDPGKFPIPFPARGQSRKVTISATLAVEKPSNSPTTYWTGKAVSEPVQVVLKGGDQ